MKTMRVFLGLAAFAVAVMLACTNKVEPEDNLPPDCEGDDCEIAGLSSSNPGGTGSSSSFSSSSGECEVNCIEPEPPSSSSVVIDPGEPGDSSSSGESLPSSSSAPIPGANCAYTPNLCGGLPWSRVITESMTGSMGGDEFIAAGGEVPNCVFATAIAVMGNENSGQHTGQGPLTVNGTELLSVWGSPNGGRCGRSDWDQKACAAALADQNIKTIDGGYYIFVPHWAGQDFITTGGTPVCGTTNPNPGGQSSSSAPTPSSSSRPSSSSSVGGGGVTGSCIAPSNPGVTPSKPKETCIKVGNECYMCSPDRSLSECSQSWLWSGAQATDAYWFAKISCDEAAGGSSTSTFTCEGLPQSGVAGTAVSRPTVKCNGATVSNPTFTGAPASWTTPSAGSYTIRASASCGGNNMGAACGTLNVVAANTSSLTCTGLATSVIAGTAITQPTVRCGNNTVTGTFTGAPASWTNPVAGTYTVTVSATCASGSPASCGTIKVNPKLACASVARTVVAGTSVTPPAVTCGTTTVNNITWAGAPALWSSPTQGTYNNVRATATSGDCNGQEATCSGTLTVNPRLTCGSVTQTITTGTKPVLPNVTCGSTDVTSGLTWTPNINNNITANTSNVTVSVSSGNCSGQSASCSGTITVRAVSSSSTPVASSSSVASSGGGRARFPLITSGGTSGWASRYWDGCKPHCAWSGNAGGNPSKTCDISGMNKVGVDTKSSCDGGGTAYTCYDHAPFILDNDVAFAFAATHAGSGIACGTCYQIDFTGESRHTSPAPTLNHIKGKTLIVKVSNIGGDVDPQGQLDIMIPGGGLGQFDGFSKQTGVTTSVIANSERYGGLVSDCHNQLGSGRTLAEYQTCHRNKCSDAFTNSTLRAGCNVYTDWFGVVNNPRFTYKTITCPAELNNKWN